MTDTITITKSESGHIYVDTVNSILHLEILNEKYNKEEFTQLYQVFKMFLLECLTNKKKYYLIFHTQKIGVYPLSCYGIIKDILEEIKPVLQKILHCTCVLVEPNLTSHILKFFFSIYTPVRPATVITELSEAESYFALPINQNNEIL
jgi:glycosyltransferase involved in cell wall biosynthesis